MDRKSAAAVLAALAHPGRLRVFQLLARSEDGIAVGELARTVNAPPNTLSTNLAILSNVGLVRSRRKGRSIIYIAAYDSVDDLIGFLLECCSGSPSLSSRLDHVGARSSQSARL